MSMNKEDLDETDRVCRESLVHFPAHLAAAEAIFWGITAEVRKGWLDPGYGPPTLDAEFFNRFLAPLGYGRLPDNAYNVLADDIMAEVQDKGGYTPCLIWDLAHTLQHAKEHEVPAH